MIRFIPAAVVAASALAILAASPADARTRHRHRAVQRSEAQAEARSQPYNFYPENIEGGVPGNLPFNNQIRKHTDPLNANGSR